MQTTHAHTAEKKTSFAAFAMTFVLLFGLMFAFMAAVDALPDNPNAPSHSSTVAAAPANPEAPVRIVAPDINLDVNVVNPTSTDVDLLDDALTQGAVHYPTSADLGVDGTVLIFGHSSYLPVVYHQYYKTFDGIQNLKVGSIVSVYSGDLEYRYSVTGVSVADATQDVVQLPTTGKHLVLVTCDSFATKSNRFVVTADFVGTYALASK
jgi:LPXTG-site transpeptidase (sortase) family protein